MDSWGKPEKGGSDRKKKTELAGGKLQPDMSQITGRNNISSKKSGKGIVCSINFSNFAMNMYFYTRSMGLTDIFKKKPKENVGGMEDFMTLIKVYFQSVLAANLGISNLASLPDMAAFKRSLHVATVNNKLGVGEKKACQKMLQDLYGISDGFFKEIDQSIKKGCKSQMDVRNYLYLFQGYSQELMMLVGNLMKWKFRIPSFLKKMLRVMIEKTVNDILTSNDWKDDGVRKSVYAVRKYQKALGFSEAWATEYVYNIVTLAKKEPRPSQDDLDKAENKMKK